jgi:sulfatase maturation enzyme AslB (radical SAM superfamily)
LQKKLNFALVTNLSLMDKEKLNFLMQNNIWISTSLDWDETIHNYNRVYKKGNSFKEVIKWIKKINDIYIKNKSKNRVWALTTVTRKTLSWYKTLIDTFIEIWIDSIFLRPLNPYWFAVKNFKDIWYTYKEFNEFYNNSMNYIMELNNKWIYIKEYFTTIFLEKILTQKDPNFLDERSPCWAWIWQVAYNYDWKIYTCDEGRMFWELWDYSFLIWEIWNDPKLNYVNIIDNNVTKSILHASITDWLPWYNDSVYKPYIWICPIYNYKKNGNIFANYTLDNRLKISSNIINYIFENIQNKKSLKIFNNWIKK